MGGKVWSDEEERVFWTEIIPTSSKRLLHDRPHAHDAKGWEDLCTVMQQAMGDRARRQYTSLMLYEHFFQNTVLKRYSPNAAKYARAYLSKEEGAAAGQSRTQRGRAVHHRPEYVPGYSGELPSPGVSDSSNDPNDPLQLALDAFQILARADYRHRGSGGFLDTPCSHAYAYGGACDDDVCRCTTASASGLDAAQSLLPLPLPAVPPPPPPHARLWPQLLPPGSLTPTSSSSSATGTSSEFAPRAGLLDGKGNDSNSSNSSSSSDSMPSPRHAQAFDGRYYGYTAALHSPGSVYGHGYESQPAAVGMGQDGLSLPSTETPVS